MSEIPDARDMLPSDWTERWFDVGDTDAESPGEPCTPEHPCAACRFASAQERRQAEEGELIDLAALWEAAHAEDPRPAA